jgi:hypothetical protein
MFTRTHYTRNFTILFILLGLIMAVIAFTSNADAGVFDVVKDKFTGFTIDRLVDYGISGLLGLLGIIGSAFGLGFLVKAKKYKQTSRELGDVLKAVYKATHKNSPGGSKITGDEFDAILKESGELVRAIITDTKGGS